MASWFNFDLFKPQEKKEEIEDIDATGGNGEEQYESGSYNYDSDNYESYDPLLSRERKPKVSQKQFNQFMSDHAYTMPPGVKTFQDKINAYWKDEKLKKMIISKVEKDSSYTIFLNRLDGPKSRSLLESIYINKDKNGEATGITYKDTNGKSYKVINRGPGGNGEFRYTKDMKLSKILSKFKAEVEEATDEHFNRIQAQVEGSLTNTDKGKYSICTRAAERENGKKNS